MRQLLVKRLIKHIEDNRILYDWNDYEEMEPAYYDEMQSLESYVKKQDWTAFIVNMAIMYVNQGLLYARCKLSKKEFNNYAIWFRIEVDEDMKESLHYYEVRTLFTRKANSILPYIIKKPIDIKNIKIYDSIKHINGLSDFYCYESIPCSSCRYYSFVPKCFIERNAATKN